MRNLWSAVVHDVGANYANVWVGTLYPDLRKPDKVVIELLDEHDNVLQIKEILKEEWLRPFRHLPQRFYQIISFTELTAATRYRARVMEYSNLETSRPYLIEAQFDTLGHSLNDYPEGLNIAIGSCFSEQYDGGSVSRSYEALYNAGIADKSPHFTILMGDQVYLDVGLDSLSMETREIRERIARDYAQHWNALSGVLRNGGTWFLSDDHEFWNNYPFYKSLNPFTQALRIDKVRNIWTQTSRDGVNNIQNLKPVRIINFGEDLSVCMADFRSQRTETKLLPGQYFKLILDWLGELKSPGVLAISQPLIDAVGEGDERRVPNYEQYDQLLRAIASAPHDILILAGDLHCGRIASFKFEPKREGQTVGRVMHEVVASPLSNLSGPTSMACRTMSKSSRPETFPPRPISGIKTDKVIYPKNWAVSSEFSLRDIRYLKTRTKEHFTTLNFLKTEHGIEVRVRPWRVRETVKSTGLPKPDFHEPVVLQMS